MEWTDEGISWEVDPRHAELIRKSSGVTAADQFRLLESKRNSTTLKERPRSGRKWRIGIVRFRCMHSINVSIATWCDTDHAGCIRTRKSVSSCALMLGNSTVCTYCKGQAVIALSSGEAEYYGLVSATSQMLGLQNAGFLNETCRYRNDAELRNWIGIEVSIR